MGVVRIDSGEVKEVVAPDDMNPGYRVHVKGGPVRLGHTRGYVRTQAIEYPEGTVGTLTDLEGKAVYGYASGPTDVSLELEDNSFGFQTTQTGTTDPDGNLVEPSDSGKHTLIEDITTGTGTANAATLTGLGRFRTKVDFIASMSGAGTLTVEVKDGNGDWITFDTYSLDGDDVIQVDTAADDVRGHIDANLNRLTAFSKGVS